MIVLMTQDALPLDNSWLAALIGPLQRGEACAAYSRQVPKEGATAMECCFLETNFPPGEVEVRRKTGDDPTYGSSFFSNVSSAIKRSVLLEHPFDETLIMSEDRQFSRDLMNAGHALAYVPSSVVIHSHAYKLTQVFKRYFDSICALREIFPEHGVGTTAVTGLPYLWREFCYVLSKYPGQIPYYILYVAAKAGGTIAGHCVNCLPRGLARRLSLHAYHWR